MNINGLLVINKPINITSNHIIEKIKKKFNLNNIGHCGTLDPLANGVLILCIGKKTKNSNIILNQKKRYIVNSIIGIKSKTYDTNGKINFYEKNKIEIEKLKIKHVIKLIQKKYNEKPPLFSSIKHNGLQLYKYARLEIDLKIKKRNTKIYKIGLINKKNNSITLDITCGKGTYIRSLINYLGKKLQQPICVKKISRISSGKYNILHSYNLKNILKLKNIQNFKNILLN